MAESAMNRTALILGATGAVGKQLLKDILKNDTYAKVVSVGRRSVELEDNIPQEKLVQKTVNFENLEAHREDFKNVNDVFCCLGTTRADAGSAENFVKIDKDYVLNSAKLIVEENKQPGAKLAPVHFLHCSSMFANKDSMLFYPRTKGETEHGLEETGFEKVTIIHPGALETVETRTRPRLGESIGIAVFRPINNLFGLKRMISVDTVGKVMHKIAQDESIKPAKADDIKTSAIGSLVSHFYNSDLLYINETSK